MSAVKHLAFFRFKDGTSQETIDQIFSELLEISESIPGVDDYVSGPNNSPEGLSKGFTHAIVMTFRDSAARDAYLPHPEHERFKANALPHIEDVAVVDFEL